MYDAVIIKPLKKRGLFSVNPQFERTEAADVFYVRDNVRSLKKVVKYAGGRKIMPDSGKSMFKALLWECGKDTV